jgi:aspartate dehydrogenase
LPQPVLRLGILGCGSIGSSVALFADQETEISAITLHDQDAARATALAKRLKNASIAPDVAALVKASDLVVEAASQEAVRRHLKAVLAAGKSAMILSMGALADDALRNDLLSTARATGAKVWLPSGAIAAIDGLKAGAMAKIKSVTLVTTKPPKGLGVDVDKWTVLFEGTAREAVKRYPQNVNVAAALSIAGIGFDETRVQVVADPLATRNSHKIIIEGDFGRLRCEVENLPSPDNPKTSWLASLSAMATLRRILNPLQMGA